MTTSPSPISLIHHALEDLGTRLHPKDLNISIPDGERTTDLIWLAARMPHLEQDFADQVWNAVIECVRTQGAEWVTVGVGLAVKPIRSVVNRLSRNLPFPSLREELEAELIAAWIALLHEVDTDRPNILGRMWAEAYKVGQRWRYRTERDFHQLVGTVSYISQRAEGGHPEVALAEAVAQEVLTQFDAELIAATRLEPYSLHEVAQMMQLSYSTAKRRRRQAERAVTRWLTLGALD